MAEVVDTDSKWTNVVEGMTAYTPEQLKQFLDDAGFTKTEIHRKSPSYATILGVFPPSDIPSGSYLSGERRTC